MSKKELKRKVARMIDEAYPWDYTREDIREIVAGMDDEELWRSYFELKAILNE